MNHLRDIARRAVPYGLPTVDLHRILVNYALDPANPEFKAPLGRIHHSRQLSDPSDVSVVNPNVDTPYSYAWLDLREGPVLLTMPPHTADRYMSAQLVDLYGYIVGYVSPRTTGNAGGTYVVHGPSSPATEDVVDGTFDCPTELCLVLVRTQLFDDADLPAVWALQDAVVITPLGPGGPPLAPPPTVDVRAPLDEGFLRSLDWMLQLMPTLPEDTQVRAELASIGCGDGGLEWLPASPDALAQAREGLTLGMQDVQRRCAAVRSSAELFGSRDFFAGDNAAKAAGAYLGILGNAAEEYLGVGYRGDEQGQPFDGRHRYRIRFALDALPPVGAFWSITVYDASQHLYANEINRHVLGSRQLPTLHRDPDDGFTLHVGHRSPGAHLEPNWLPCPDGPFALTFRTYLPGAAIRDGSWTAPPVYRAD